MFPQHVGAFLKSHSWTCGCSGGLLVEIVSYHLLDGEVGGDLVGAHGGGGPWGAADYVVLPAVLFSLRKQLLCYESNSSHLMPHSQEVPVTWWVACVRLEVESELKVVGQLLLGRGLVLVEQDRLMVAALESSLVGLHPAGGVLLLQQVSPRSWLAILVEWNPVDRTLDTSVANARGHVHTRELELASGPSKVIHAHHIKSKKNGNGNYLCFGPWYA